MNEQKAFEWFLKSTKNKNINAQYEIAKYYNNNIQQILIKEMNKKHLGGI